MIIENLENGLNLKSFLELKESNIHHNSSHFGEKIKNFKELYYILLRYSIPFFKNDDFLYLSKPELKNEIIIFENNNSIISLIDGILLQIAEANYLCVNVLQRSVFEFLIINNHLILTKDNQYIEKWRDEKDVKIVKNILKKTNNKNQKELIDFWVQLSRLNHASQINSQTEFDWSSNYGNYIDSMFFTYLLLYFYNYQLRELYFPFMQNVYKENNIHIKSPYKSDWFKKKDKIKELDKENNSEKLYRLVSAFTYKWKLKR